MFLLGSVDGVSMQVGISAYEMLKALEAEWRARKLETFPKAIRSILGEYFKIKEG